MGLGECGKDPVSDECARHVREPTEAILVDGPKFDRLRAPRKLCGGPMQILGCNMANYMLLSADNVDVRAGNAVVQVALLRPLMR